MLLAVDTSGPFCVMALADGAQVVGVRIFAGHRQLSQRFFGELSALMAGVGAGVGDLQLLVCGVGPGSFTGLRVGMTSMKTMAQALNIPICGVSTLEAYAWPLVAENTAVGVLLPSRHNEVYFACYDLDGATMAPTAAAPVDALAALRSASAGGSLLLTGPAVAQVPSVPDMSVEAQWPSPYALVALGRSRFQSGCPDTYLNLVPAYVVEPTITTPKPPKFRFQ